MNRARAGAAARASRNARPEPARYTRAMLFRTAIAATALSFSGIAAAQNVPAASAQPGAASPRAIPQFQVEVLIFTHRDFDPGEEQFALEDRRAPPRVEELRETSVFDDPAFAPSGDGAAPLGAPVAPAATAPLGADATAPLAPDAAQLANAAPPENEFTFRVLRPEELQLTSQYRVLNRLQAYHPLVHGGWVQLGLPDNEALPVDLGVLGVRNPVGTIRLSLTRFLHVKLDLSYVDARTAPIAPAPASAEDSLAELPLPTRYHLTAERTTRSGELHYFDHPAFGVLIKITPVKPDANAPGGTRPAA
jgi:hypothetical protein